MARHRRFSFDFKRQLVLDFLEGREGLRELARKHNVSRSLIRQWIQKYETGQLTDELDPIASPSMRARSRNWSARSASSPWKSTS
jgi:transposase-like protein